MDLPNIAVIIVDTLRRDSISPYSNEASTPNIKNLSEISSVSFRAYSSSTWTVPAHASLWTGDLPSVHGVHQRRSIKDFQLFGAMNKVLEKRLPLVLKEKGYNTVGISTNPHLSFKSGFESGFNHFTYLDPQLKSSGIRNQEEEFISKYGSLKGIVRKSVTKLDFNELRKYRELYGQLKSLREVTKYPKNKGSMMMMNIIEDSHMETPFFLFINLMEMHEPYSLKEMRRVNFNSIMRNYLDHSGIGSDIVDEIRKNYIDETKVVDSFIGSFMDFLKRNGTFDNTLIVLTSDHGQDLFENGFYGHGVFPSEEVLRIPLFVKAPKGLKQVKFEGFQNLKDVYHYLSGVDEGLEPDILNNAYNISESFGSFHDLSGIPEDALNDIERTVSVVHSGEVRGTVDRSTNRLIDLREINTYKQVTSEKHRDEVLNIYREFYNE